MLGNVVFQVAGYSPELCRDRSTLPDRLHVLVSPKKAECVGVILESFDNAKYALQIGSIVGAFQIARIQALVREGGVDIDEHVDADGIEDANTEIMVQRRIKVVNTNSVDAKSLHKSSISQAVGAIAQWILSTCSKAR